MNLMVPNLTPGATFVINGKTGSEMFSISVHVIAVSRNLLTRSYTMGLFSLNLSMMVSIKTLVPALKFFL